MLNAPWFCLVKMWGESSALITFYSSTLHVLALISLSVIDPDVTLIAYPIFLLLNGGSGF